MAEVTNDLLYDVLRRLRSDMADLELGQTEHRAELQAVRGPMVAMQQDTTNLHGRLGFIEVRLDRTERRLDLVDTSA